VRLDLAWQEWQVAGQARLLAVRIAGLQEVSGLDEQSLVRADLSLTRALQAAARGDIRADEVEARRIAAADTADRARTTERDLATARLDLNKQLGLTPQTIVPVAIPPSPTRTLDAEALFAESRSARLDLLALQSGYASQEAAVRKAVLDEFPTLQLTVATASDTAGNKTLGPQVAFTLPLWNRNRGGIAIAQATRAQLRAEYAARLFTTRADIAALVSGLRLEQRQRADIAAQTGPISMIVSATEAAARRGDLALATAEIARQSLIDKQRMVAALDQAIAEQTVALGIAVGAPLGVP
jgi:outer membrane protein TolC